MDVQHRVLVGQDDIGTLTEVSVNIEEPELNEMREFTVEVP